MAKDTGFIAEFKQFIARGNVMDMAVGVIIGGAFGKITTSLVNDIFMPLLGILTGGINFGGLFYALDGNEYASIEAAAEAGVGTLNYGAFLQNVFNFLIIAFCVFLIVKLMSKILPKKEEAPKEDPRKCPFCKGEVDKEAVKCPHCTSDIANQ